MQCPFCKTEETRVVDSRQAEEGAVVRRRRECGRCGQRFTTFEKAQLSMPLILKRKGNPVPFDEAKLRRGIEAALYKRPVTSEQVEILIDHVSAKLRGTGEREVPSRQVGEWVMEELRDLDPVAFVRFASIYRKFEDVQAFQEEVERLKTLPTAEQRRSQMVLIEEPPGKPRDGR